jgi:hypothetical protein
MTTTTPPVLSTRLLRIGYIAFAAILAVLYDFLFWGQEQGLSFIIFLVVYLLGFFAITLFTKQFRQPWALLLLIPIGLLSSSVVLYSNDLVTFYVTKMVFILTVVFSFLATLDNPNKHKFSFRHIPLLNSIDLPFTQWSSMYKDVIQWNEDKDKNIVRQIAIGLVIALPLLAIFGTLFAGADQLFSDWVKNVFKIDDLPLATWRVIRTIGFTLFTASFLYIIFSTVHALAAKEHKVWKLNPVTTSVVLVLVNILFAVFLAFQFTYLFGAKEFVMQSGTTFAEYARQGFFQLAWVIGLAAIMILIVCRSFAHHGSKLPVTFLQSLFILQVGVVAFSALKRMNLYQEAYGYTVMRLYVEWFIYFAMAIFGAVLISLWVRISFRRLWHGILILGTIAFTGVAMVNVDGMIAQKNVGRFLNGKDIDINYLDKLSADVIPTIKVLADEFFHGNNVGLYNVDRSKITPRKMVEVVHLINDKAQILGERNNWREWQVFSGTYKQELDQIERNFQEEFAKMLDQELRYQYVSFYQGIQHVQVSDGIKQGTVNPCFLQMPIAIDYEGECRFVETDNRKVYVIENIFSSDSSTTTVRMRVYERPLNQIIEAKLLLSEEREEGVSQSRYYLNSLGFVRDDFNMLQHYRLVMEKKGDKYVLNDGKGDNNVLEADIIQGELKKFKEELRIQKSSYIDRHGEELYD